MFYKVIEKATPHMPFWGGRCRLIPYPSRPLAAGIHGVGGFWYFVLFRVKQYLFLTFTNNCAS